MEKSITWPVVLLLLVMGIACKPGAGHQHENQPELSLELNQGQAWKANPETTAGIHAMAALVNDMPKSPDAADCVQLRQSLTTELQRIVQQCTMTGEAHEQLHHYLQPLGDLIQQLDGDDAATCHDHTHSLKQLLAQYDTYFTS